MDQQNLTLAKIPILDTGKFEQWQFRIQKYLQHEHYALWEVIKFGDSYEVPASTASTTTTNTTSGGTGKKSGRTVTLTTENMQKRKNDVKARTTLLLSLPNEHQLRFTEGSETLEQTFNKLQVIVGQLQFMDVEVEQDDLNQKFLTSLAPEWLMHTIVWRNKSDLDTMSLDDLYNHLKVYESEVQKKSEPNSQNMAFISSAKQSRGNEDVNTASVSTASTNVPTASANIGVASISQDTACAYIASQSSVEWKLYDMCGVNQVTSKDKEIFMLVEKDYPLRKGLALVMICYKLQVENYSHMANDLILKIYKIANSLRQQVKKVPTARRKKMPLPRGLHCWESVR
nr:hypothetical protein [Tanacetum cinerariifolium]